jgi:hypothetical protein
MRPTCCSSRNQVANGYMNKVGPLTGAFLQNAPRPGWSKLEANFPLCLRLWWGLIAAWAMNLLHSELRYCNDGYHDRNIFEQRRRQVLPGSLGQTPAGSRATQRADNGPDRAREQAADQRTCRRTHRGAHQTSAQDARNELRWGLAALACGARDRRDCRIGPCEDQHRTVWVTRPGIAGNGRVMRCISFTAQLGRTWKCRAVASVYPRLVCGVIRTDR